MIDASARLNHVALRRGGVAGGGARAAIRAYAAHRCVHPQAENEDRSRRTSGRRRLVNLVNASWDATIDNGPLDILHEAAVLHDNTTLHLTLTFAGVFFMPHGNESLHRSDRAHGPRARQRRAVTVCRNCHHEKIMNVDHLPGDLSVPSLGRRMACTKCGTVGADVRPNWRDRGW
jgi:hypothetical protein